MNRRREIVCSLFAMLMWVAPAWGQIAYEAQYEADDPIIVSIAGEPIPGAKASYEWTSPTAKLVDVDGRRVAVGSLPGTTHHVECRATYTIRVFTPDPAAPSDPTKAKLTELPLPPYVYTAAIVRKPAPGPVPPGPNPPGPTPPPIVEAGLRVLVVYDANAKATLPRAQMALIDSPTFRGWLDAHCARAKDGTPEWRIVPDITIFNADQPVWQKAMAVPRHGLPWLVVSNGEAGESVPLPADEQAALALIAKYAK